MSNLQQHWPNESPVFSVEQLAAFSNNPSKPNSNVNLDTIIRNSASFPIEFPVNSLKCEYLQAKGISSGFLERNANSVYPILHESALPLFLQFLHHKKRFGSNVEKTFYKNFTVEQLVDRLLSKRAVVFCGRSDMFMLLDGFSNCGNWEIIGTSEEKPPRILENCLSYDEIKLSALLSVSSYTYFINDGSRDNCGKYLSDRKQLEDVGIIIGLIGARFEKPGVMEYQDIVVSKEQNVQGKGYGNTFVPTLQGSFMDFYGEPSLAFDQLKSQFSDNLKYTPLREGKYFNNHVYEKRLSLSIDTLLIEANGRARELDKMAFVFVVGIGLGVWKISSHQNQVFMDVFSKRIRFLGRNLSNISDILFSYIGSTSCGKYRDQDIMPIAEHKNGGIKIHFKNRNPHIKLTGPDQGKLLVVSYAWDGNALPGNEFWMGQLAASGDPAAASSTQIAELHNPHINPKVSGANLRIATLNNGVEPFCDYIKRKQEVV